MGHEVPFGYVQPSQRFQRERSWWYASELAWRLPGHIVYEKASPGDFLDVRPARRGWYGIWVSINRGGTIRVEEHREDNQVRSIHAVPSWASFEQRPHALLHELMEAVGLTRGTERADGGRSTAYRFMSAVLTSRLNSIYEWDCQNAMFDGDDFADRAYFELFPDAADDLRQVQLEGWEWNNDARQHFWALTRDAQPIAMISDLGRLYYPGGGSRFSGRVDLRRSCLTLYGGNMRVMAADLLKELDEDEEYA